MQVADCYIHVEYRNLTRDEFSYFSEHLFRIATNLASNVKRGQELDFTFEEGTLIQRILLAGTLMMSTLDFVSHYHDLRQSVIDMVHDGETFSQKAIEEFHHFTKTTPHNDIYTRTSSRDMNRLSRIVEGFDRAVDGDIPRSELPHIRAQVVHDLAGLARANPNDPQIANIIHALPKGHVPGLPRSPADAIAIDDAEFEHKRPDFEEPEYVPVPRRSRRRFHKQIPLLKR
jgi:hypothetical protein